MYCGTDEVGIGVRMSLPYMGGGVYAMPGTLPPMGVGIGVRMIHTSVDTATAIQGKGCLYEVMASDRRTGDHDHGCLRKDF